MQSSPETERYLDAFRRFRSAEPGPSWIRPLREGAIARFAEIGFPTPREEDWKYTNVSRLVSIPFRPAFEVPPGASVSPDALGRPIGPRLVFVNGSFAAELSSLAGLPAGVRIETLASALQAGDDAVARNLGRHASSDASGFTALATAFLQDGAFIELADGATLDAPIELSFVATARAELVTHPRVLVVCGRQSRATIVERYRSSAEAATLTNAVVEIVLGEDAGLSHVRIASEGGRSSHVATTEVVQSRSSRYDSSAFAIATGFLRHNLNVRLAGEGAECSLDGLYLAAGEEFVDNHTAIDHVVAHGTSRELYKGILAGRARAVFNGKVLVRPEAQKTDARQTNKNLLLSEAAEIDTKPELQILADDVKCAHGAAIGQLDDEALFYLKSRGIDEALGRRMLTRGFANEVVERLAVEPLRPTIERAIGERLERDLVEGGR